MQRWGNRIQALIGLWFLAGLVVIGANGYVLVSLLDEPLSGHSTAVRNADRGFRQYRRLLTAETEKITSGMDRLVKRFVPQAVAKAPPISEKAALLTTKKKPAKPIPVVLPALAGIVTSRSTTGSVNRLAMLDGGVFSEGDTWRELTVKGISAGGVVLARGNRTWFLKAPEIAYSLTTR